MYKLQSVGVKINKNEQVLEKLMELNGELEDKVQLTKEDQDMPIVRWMWQINEKPIRGGKSRTSLNNNI